MLDAAELPVADLTPQMLTDFLLADSGGLTVGLVGLQIFDKTGLLRSLVVASRERRTGLGSELLAAIEAVARNAGIEELWLLTIDAESFFLAHEFEVLSRDRAPGSIRSTAEFRDLCPGDAHLMRKALT
ncbi:MAG: amino-acid N-acetyltransferase [Woeseiaceae bacterium]